MKHLLLVSILIWISPFVSAGIPFEFDEPVRINTTYRGESRPLVASNSLGHVVVVWTTEYTGEFALLSSKSNDFGATWSTPIRVDNGTSSKLTPHVFCITTVSDIELAVAWKSLVGSDGLFSAYSTDFGSSWLAYNSRIDDGSPGIKDEVCIVSDGTRLVAFWGDTRTGRPTLQSSYSLDKGMTWSSPDIRVDDDDTVFSTKSFLSLHASSDGSFLATWADKRNNNNFDIWSSRSADGGLSWSANIQVNSNYPGYQQSNSIGEGAFGDVHVVYFNSTGMFRSEINSATTMDFGLTWTDTPDTINDPPLNYDCGTPAITGCVDGTLVAVWSDDRTGDWFTYLSFSEDMGATWSHPNTLLVSDTPGQPDICALPDGGFMVVYQYLSTTELPHYAIRARRVEATPTATPTGEFPGTNTPIPTHSPTSTPTPVDQTATPSPTFTPVPTLTPTPSPYPTSTPTPVDQTATPSPTFTPVPTLTPTPSPYPTSTPTPVDQTATPTPTPTPTPLVTGVTITMPTHHFRPGDACYCTVIVTNGEPGSLNDNPLFLILDVYGVLFFGPSFTHDADWYPGPWPSGDTRVEAIPAFIWPETGTSATGIIWYAALTDPAVTRIIGDWDTWEFGWE